MSDQQESAALLEQFAQNLTQSLQSCTNQDLQTFQHQILQLHNSALSLDSLIGKCQKARQLKCQLAQTLEETRLVQERLQQAMEKACQLQQQNQMKRIELQDRLAHSQPCQMELNAFVEWAGRLSLCAAAPVGYLSGAPLEPFKAPVPTEDMMRKSVLYGQGKSVAGFAKLKRNEENKEIEIEFSHEKEDANARIEEVGMERGATTIEANEKSNAEDILVVDL